MPNAKDAQLTAAHKFLMLGKTGSGKTAGFLTLTGKKFIYCFDPNSLLTLQGQDVDYEEFLPADLSMKATSLSEKQRVKLKGDQKPKASAGRDLYERWERDFEQRISSGFFDSYDAIGFDSFTTLSDMVMDTVLAINGRAGQWPQQDDYGPQMMTLTAIVRTAAGLGKTIYFTGHIETIKDEITSRIMNQPIMTGRLRAKIPLLFSEVLLLSAETDIKGNTSFICQTRPDRLNDSVRCSLKSVDFKPNVTIDWKKPVVGQGIGELYK